MATYLGPRGRWSENGNIISTACQPATQGGVTHMDRSLSRKHHIGDA